MSQLENQPTTIAEVEALAAKYGITFSPDDYARAHEMMEARRTQLEAQESLVKGDKTAQWVDTFNKWYPRFLKALIGVGDVAISLTQTVLIAFGVPLVLVMLMIVEQQRTQHGIALFEVNVSLAVFSAWALVILNLVLELLISYVEHRAGWIEPPKYQFSFRLLRQRLAYLMGSTDFAPQSKSPAVRFRAVLRIVTFAILALALAGSMRGVIERTGGNWFEAIGLVLTRSSLIEMTTWIGGLLFALAAVLAAQALSKYVATKMIEVVTIMASHADNKPSLILDAIGATGASVLIARMKELQKARRFASAPALRSTDEQIEGIGSREPDVNQTAGAGKTGEGGSSGSALNRALSYLMNHPECEGLSNRQIAEQSGLSVSSIQRARKAHR